MNKPRKTNGILDVHVHFDAELGNILRELSQDEGRTYPAQIRYAIKMYHERKQEPHQKPKHIRDEA